jgi:hypothetical protein
MPNQVDLTPASSNTTGLHVHTPNGASASGFDNPTDVITPIAKAAVTSVAKNINGVDGKICVRFANPS